MEAFELAFKPEILYDSFFFDIKHVSEFSNVMELKKNKPELYLEFLNIAKTKYNLNIDAFESESDELLMMLNDIYVEKAVFFPEFSKIVGITYGSVKIKDNTLNRSYNKIISDDEFSVVNEFKLVLDLLSKIGMESTPQYFPTLCGFNVLNYTLPLFIKKLVIYRKQFENNEGHVIPYILKQYLKSKPWDCKVLDSSTLWKFNGISNSPLSIIKDVMGLKIGNSDLLSYDEFSKKYWGIENVEERDKLVYDESINTLNLNVQFINEIRRL